MSDEVLVEVHGEVLVITMNRPDQRNAMTLASAEGIAAGLDLLDGDPGLRVGILTGAGGTFCAGMDLKRYVELDERPFVVGRGFGGLTERPPRKPLIAAVEGWALGGGFEMVLACDLVVAGETAQFGRPEVKRGLVARGGGLVRLSQRLPRAIALELLMTGEPITAERAEQFGLVNTLTPDGGSLGGATRLARSIAANAPLEVEVAKTVADASQGWPQEQIFELQAPFTDAVFASQDAKEGSSAFVEQRSPRWTGL
jgi:enoyl-CoA hydratase/carnithine racemase